MPQIAGGARSSRARESTAAEAEGQVLVPLEPGGRRYTIVRRSAVAGLVAALLLPTPAQAGAQEASEPPRTVPVTDGGGGGEQGRPGGGTSAAVSPAQDVPERHERSAAEANASGEKPETADPSATVPAGEAGATDEKPETADPPATFPAGEERPTAVVPEAEPEVAPADAVSVLDPVVEAAESAVHDRAPLVDDVDPLRATGRRAGGWEVPTTAVEGALATTTGSSEGTSPPPTAAAPAPAGSSQAVPPPQPQAPPPAPEAAPARPAERPAPERHAHGQAASTNAVAAVAGGTYTVQLGDSLWAITGRVLGTGSPDASIAGAWPALYAANRDRIGPDPNLILPGTVLSIPERL